MINVIYTLFLSHLDIIFMHCLCFKFHHEGWNFALLYASPFNSGKLLC